MAELKGSVSVHEHWKAMADSARRVNERIRRIEEGLVLHPETRKGQLLRQGGRQWQLTRDGD